MVKFEVEASPINGDLQILLDYYESNFEKKPEDFKLKDSPLVEEGKQICFEIIKNDIKMIENLIDGVLCGDEKVSLKYIPVGCKTASVSEILVDISDTDIERFDRHFEILSYHPIIGEAYQKICHARECLRLVSSYKAFFHSLDSISERKMKYDIIHKCCKAICKELCKDLFSFTAYIQIFDLVEKCLDIEFEYSRYNFRKALGLLGVAYNFRGCCKPVLHEMTLSPEEEALVTDFRDKFVLIEGQK